MTYEYEEKEKSDKIIYKKILNNIFKELEENRKSIEKAVRFNQCPSDLPIMSDNLLRL